MFPAHAGMNRISVILDDLREYVPRTRGDEPNTTTPVKMIHCLMFPAHAGMNRSPPAAPTAALDVPRTRGDEPGPSQRIKVRFICSPHTRG